MRRRQVWLVGGTQESAALARAIAAAELPYVVTIATESARVLYPSTGCVWVGRLSAAQLEMFLQEHSVGCILDASHPFAVEVSQMAIAASGRWGLPYLRYERPSLLSTPSDIHPAEHLHVDRFEALLERNLLVGERVLLTVGYRSLPLFQPWHDRAALFARILPSPVALEAALAAGFTPDRLIALRPPIGRELERALWQQWQISTVVTKASGAPGGEDTKQQVAAELGVRLITVDRPAVAYPQQTSEVAAAIAFCQQHIPATKTPESTP